MTAEASLEGNFTNHSLRATGATVLYDARIPEGVLQKWTGYKSLDMLRCYERTTLTLTHIRSVLFTAGNRSLGVRAAPTHQE